MRSGDEWERKYQEEVAVEATRLRDSRCAFVLSFYAIVVKLVKCHPPLILCINYYYEP